MDAAVGLHEFCADASYWLIAAHVIAAVASRRRRGCLDLDGAGVARAAQDTIGDGTAAVD